MKRASRSRRAAVGLLGMLFSGVAALWAQDEPATAPATFAEVVDVRVVNIEVVVTDRRGQRVTGLRLDDFELEVDGDVVPIDYFTEVRSGIMVDAAGAKPVPALSASGDVGTSYLVFVDDYFALRPDRDRVLRFLKEQLVFLGPEDRMAIVAFDGTGLEMISTWSQSPRELERAVQKAEGRPTFGLERRADLRGEDLTRRDSRLFPFSSDIETRLDVDERYYAERLVQQLQRVVAAATSTIRSFAAPPGRKVMLLFSGGWPYDPVEYLVDDTGRPVVEPDLPSGAGLYSPLSDTANLLGYTLYTVDVAGLEGSGSGVVGSVIREEGNTLVSQSFEREQLGHRSLEFLADMTGGQAMINSGRGEVLKTVFEDTRSYYWLGFVPQRRGDDQRHRVKVRVLQQGLRVRARDGFLDFSRQREVSMAVESALYFGSPPSPEPLLVEVGRPQRAGMRRMRVPLEIHIPVESITLLPNAERYAAQLELRFAVLDEGGNSAEPPVVPLDLELEGEPKKGQFLRYETHLEMRKRRHDVVVALYDVLSGAILSTTLEISP